MNFILASAFYPLLNCGKGMVIGGVCKYLTGVTGLTGAKYLTVLKKNRPIEIIVLFNNS